jgi:cytochrome c peroxidase
MQYETNLFLRRCSKKCPSRSTYSPLISLPKRVSVKTLMHTNGYLIVKVSGAITALFAVFIIVTASSYKKFNPVSFNERVDKYYQHQLTALEEKIISFRIATRKKASVETLKTQFRNARLIYKKVAVITEYFNIYQTKFLNYPALDRIEEDLPMQIIHPEGFQAIEQLLFTNWTGKSYTQLNFLLGKMLATINNLKTELDRSNKFSEALVWDALRSSLIRLMTEGITGFDSPIAQYSLEEATATLQGITDILMLFEDHLGQPASKDFPILRNALKRSKDYILHHANFNSFDRLVFISNHIDPLYKELVETRIKNHIDAPEGSFPVDANATSIFDANALNASFFSPGPDYLPTPERIALGKLLFFDPILSGNNSRSCGSCHNPEKAFADGLKTPFAIDNKTLLKRNTPTLLYSVFQAKQFWDSRADILENQLTEVVHNESEMKGSFKKSAEDLKSSQLYAPLFNKAYEGQTEAISPFNIANAICSYIRSLHPFDSRFDRYMRGDISKLNVQEKNGFNLFTGKAKCATCHFMPVFNSLVPPVYTESESEVLGVPSTNLKKGARLDDDPGKFILTNSVIHKNAFKTPTLRNIELTAPYMHNGVFNSLQEVMDFYNHGGGKGLKIAPSNQSLPFDRLNLTKNEIADIISFMRTLTDSIRTASNRQ